MKILKKVWQNSKERKNLNKNYSSYRKTMIEE